jgi:hypothetical protein
MLVLDEGLLRNNTTNSKINKIVTTDDFFDAAEDFDDKFNEQDDIAAAREQLVNDEYQARLEEDINFKERTEQIIETSKSALTPRTLKVYTSLVPIFP